MVHCSLQNRRGINRVAGDDKRSDHGDIQKGGQRVAEGRFVTADVIHERSLFRGSFTAGKRGIEEMRALFLHHPRRIKAWTIQRPSSPNNGAADTVAGHPGKSNPGAAQHDASLGVAVRNLGVWDGEPRVQYIGPRPGTEGNSIRSLAITRADGVSGP